MSYLSDFLGDAYKEGMTEDEISSAMQSRISEMDSKHATEVNGLRASISKSNSEAADYKKQLRSKQSEDEKRAADQKAEWDKMVARNEALERTLATSDLSGKLISSGYTAELAAETAKAMLDGDYDSVLKNQKTFLENREKEIKAGIMKDVPHPGSGSEGNINYQNMIDKANASGDYAAVAYYMRLAQNK